ncbi:hypothetical protein J41TS12_37060 [Paenibacillus antibioticophila]|uniref:Polymerase beta nucleotidyltransferase domain-containing protein n=1 Tax=Paenibacillus antibioticophila TaxID=1274374 RepID=A0A920CGM1_9BACL|nr:nucleotidyltransferase domain-containing protein [Paenibacillus antibioticophila]GIO38845.1 hypothetical protein J41TS12_37060 [Paenibacillus antibioticophila]
MNVIDSIIENRSKLMEVAAAQGVKQLKLYGSVLTRTEKPESDIDFLAMFDPSIPYEWNVIFQLQQKIEAMFNRRVSILDSRRLPEVFIHKLTMILWTL